MTERRKNNKARIPVRKADSVSLREMHNLLIAHFRDDTKRFEAQEEEHKAFNGILGEIKGFMENLSWLSDISRGTQLLKRPSLWVVAFILGLVALMGGLKALAVYFMSWIIPR